MESLEKREIRTQMSEALLTALLLSFSGGLQDAYTFLMRGGVFANAQTGNIVLLSVNFLGGRWDGMLKYLIPVISFALGVLVAELIKIKLIKRDSFHWRQLVVLVEIVLLFIVGLLESGMNALANAMVSFACAMQVEAFRRMEGQPFSSTMCIGNLRSGMEALCDWSVLKDQGAKKKALRYLAVILCFALGAGVGGLLLAAYGERTIWASCIVLTFAFLLMFLKEKPRFENL